MHVIRPLTDDEMVAAFLKAEMQSSRFRPRIDKWVKADDPRLAWLSDPDVADAVQCEFRAFVLSHTRGWRSDREGSLLKSLPHDTQWQLVRMSLDELLWVRFIKEGYWIKHTNGERTFEALIEHAPADSPILEISRFMTASAYQHPMIAVGHDLASGLVMMEGNGRLSGAAASGVKTFDVIIGTSPSMSSWLWW